MISIITPVRAKSEEQVEWLNEAIASVLSQKPEGVDVEMVVVDDHSPASLSRVQAAWPQVRWLRAEHDGVSAARNQAAEAAHGEFLLPLDADDKLSANALAAFLQAWETRGDAGIIYSDVVMFGQDYAQVYLAAEYSFDTLLRATFMTVGCLHRKADWERIGGWRLDMNHGLEDWEYWIALGEAGVCGKRLAEPLYWYRRHPTGRLAWLRSNRELWNKAYQAMREIHRASYNGRYPVGCCGGRAPKGATRNPRGGVARAPVQPQAEIARATAKRPGGDLVPLVYVGPRKGGFQIIGGVSRVRYRVPGQGRLLQQVNSPHQGVRPEDVAWFRTAAGGRDYRVLEVPKPVVAPEAVAPQPVPAPVPETEQSEAWTPQIMEAVGVIEQNADTHTETEPEPVEDKPKRARKTRRASAG